MLNDGNPNAPTPPGYDDITYTKACVERIEKTGAKVIQIAVDQAVQSNKMYTTFVKYTNMATLINDCGNLLYNLLEKTQ